MKVLFIGGGPAGATAAKILAQKFDVTLIQDKKWDKPCGGGVKAKIFKNLDTSFIKHKISNVKMIYKNKTITLDLKGDNLVLVKREEFDEYLRNSAVSNEVKLYYGKFKGFENKKAVVKINGEKVFFGTD